MVADPSVRALSNIPQADGSAPEDPQRSPDNVSPMMLVLAHESCPVNGETLEAGLGRFARIFVAETRGIVSPGLSAEGILERWPEIVNETDYLVPAHTKESVTFREEQIRAAR